MSIYRDRATGRLLILSAVFVLLISIWSIPIDSHEISQNGDFEIIWVDNWMEDDPDVTTSDEDIAFNYDDNGNNLYYLGDQGAEIELLMYNDGTNDFYDLYISLSAMDPIITGIPDNRWPPTGDYGDIPPGPVFSPGERIDSDPGGTGSLPTFTINIETSGEVNTLYNDALEITISYVEDVGGGTPRTDTFMFDIYISSVFDNDTSNVEIDIRDELPDINETDASPHFEPGQNSQEGIMSLTNHAEFDITDIEGILSNPPNGINFSWGVDSDANAGPINGNGGTFELFWDFNVSLGVSPGYYPLNLGFEYTRNDTGQVITENPRPTGLSVAATAFATGPVGGPANDEGITITYGMTGSLSTIDLYYTNDLNPPFSWNFIGNDSSPDGLYAWTIPTDGSYGWMAVSDNETTPSPLDLPEASFYIYDGTAPYVDNTEPSLATIDVEIDSDVVITFNEQMITNSISYTFEPNPGGLSESWSSGSMILTLSHSDFLSEIRYWINITAAKDQAGNDLTILPYSFYFDSLYIPSTAMALGPISGPNNDDQVTITYNTTEDPTHVELYYTTNTDSPYTWTMIGKDEPEDGSFDWTLHEDGYYGWFAVSPDESTPGPGDAPEAAYYVYDGTRPGIINASPENLAEDVSLNTKINVVFDESMDISSVEVAFSFTDGQTIWDFTQGITTWNANRDHMTFTPTYVLAYGITYTVSITTGAEDIANNSLASTYSWSFTTLPAPDTTAPFITSVVPLGNHTELTNSLTILFSESMNNTSVEDSISISGDPQIQSYDWIGTTLTVTLIEDTEYDTIYTVMVGTGAKDLSGNSLNEPFTWTFKTKEMEEREDDEPSQNSFLILVFLIFFLVIILLIILMKKRKPKENTIEKNQDKKQDESTGDIPEEKHDNLMEEESE